MFGFTGACHKQRLEGYRWELHNVGDGASHLSN